MARELEIAYHSASVVVFPNNGFEKVFLGTYDEGYPVETWRGHFSFIGGVSFNDVSPRATLEREFVEEFIEEDLKEVIRADGSVYVSPQPERESSEEDFAEIELRKLTKDRILSIAKPFQDYLIKFDQSHKPVKGFLPVLTSVYLSLIDPNLFEKIERSIQEGEKLRNEGKDCVVRLETLAKGELRGAWGYDHILNDILKKKELSLDIPRYDFVDVNQLNPGKVLGTYREYKAAGIEYKKDPEAK